jgi:hypothetical protein
MSLYWSCATRFWKAFLRRQLNVPNNSKPAVCKATFGIYLGNPAFFKLANDLKFYPKNESYEYLKFAETLLKVCDDTLLSDAFNHRIDYDNLRPKKRVWMPRRRTKAVISIEPELPAPRESVIG